MALADSTAQNNACDQTRLSSSYDRLCLGLFSGRRCQYIYIKVCLNPKEVLALRHNETQFPGVTQGVNLHRSSISSWWLDGDSGGNRQKQQNAVNEGLIDDGINRTCVSGCIKYLFSGFQTEVRSHVAQKHCRLSPDIQYQGADLWSFSTGI